MSSPPFRPLDVRRAVLAELLRARRPVSITEIVTALDGLADNRRVSDVLRHQCAAGRVERIGRGVYTLLPNRFSRSTRWRILNWPTLHQRWWEAWSAGRRAIVAPDGVHDDDVDPDLDLDLDFDLDL